VLGYAGLGHAPFAEKPAQFNLDLANFATEANLAINPGTVFSDCDDCPELVVIPTGDFLMGSNVGTEERDESPVPIVNITRAFAIGRYEVTNAQFAAFIADTGHDTADGCNMFFPEDMEVRREPGVTWRDPG